MNRKTATRISFAALVMATIVAAPVLAFAQSNPDPSVLFTALLGHDWPVVVGFGLYWVFAFVKQGWVGTWLQAKLPARFLPLISPAIGALGAYCADLLAGQSFAAAASAILPGVLAGILPVVGHEVVVESLRGGRELVKAKPTSGGGGDGTATAPVVPLRDAIRDPGKSAPPAAKRFAWLRPVTAIVGLATVPPLAMGAAVSACTAAQAANVESAIQTALAYVSEFLPGVEAIWAIIEPLLPASSQAQANTDFQLAVTTLTGAETAAQDALAASQNPSDAAALLTNIQAAVQQIVNIIEQYTGTADGGQAGVSLAGAPSVSLAKALSVIEHQAAQVQAVRP